MVKKEFVCTNCGKRFVTEVLEPGEAERKNIGTKPLICPECGSTSIKRT